MGRARKRSRKLGNRRPLRRALRPLCDLARIGDLGGWCSWPANGRQPQLFTQRSALTGPTSGRCRSLGCAGFSSCFGRGFAAGAVAPARNAGARDHSFSIAPISARSAFSARGPWRNVRPSPIALLSAHSAACLGDVAESLMAPGPPSLHRAALSLHGGAAFSTRAESNSYRSWGCS